MPRHLALLSLLIVVFLPFCAMPAQAEFTPVLSPELTVSHTNESISIDGILDDPGWRNAPVFDRFTEFNPGDQVEPPVKTEVMMTYDDENVYIAFVCYDDPSTIRASFCERDNIFSDDYVIIGLDPFGDAATGYEFACNPYGIQGDLFYSAAADENSRYDYVYETAARFTDEGWIAEFAIPFNILRFPGTDEQVWKVEFNRNRPREVRRQFSWVARDRDNACWVCQWGTVYGIRNIHGGRGIKLLPAFIADQAGSRNENGDFEDGDIHGEPSFSGTYDITSDMTAEVTINPDFSQVESDATQIDVNSKYALHYAEKRPFFQEGSDLFSTWFSAVYTRSINDPTVAGKLTGRTGKTSYAFLTAQDEHSAVVLPFEESTEIVAIGKSHSNILRLRQELGDMAHVGIIATDRRYNSGGSGSLFGVDSRIRLSKTYQIEVQAVRTFTDEPDKPELTADFHDVLFDDGRHTAGFNGESFTGNGLYSSLERHGRSWSFDADYWDYSPTFRADNGFETSNNSRLGNVWTNYEFRFDDSKVLKTLTPRLSASRIWNYDGQNKEDNVSFELEGSFRFAQASFHGRCQTGSELYGGVQLKDVTDYHMCFHSRPSDLLAIGGNANYGRKPYYSTMELGRQSDYGLWFDLKPIDRLLMEFSWNYSQSGDLDTDSLYYSGYNSRGKMSLQLTRELSTRLVVQYSGFSNRWEIDPLITYQINPFSIFYIGSTRDYMLLSETGMGDRKGNADSWHLTDRQYFMKLQYLFQL